MKKLKTLKDLDTWAIGFTEPEPKVDVKELRAEAIKWIKEMELNAYKDTSKKPLLVPKNKREFWLFTEYRQKFMDFFNITDLRDMYKNDINKLRKMKIWDK